MYTFTNRDEMDTRKPRKKSIMKIKKIKFF